MYVGIYMCMCISLLTRDYDKVILGCGFDFGKKMDICEVTENCVSQMKVLASSEWFRVCLIKNRYPYIKTQWG